MHGNSGMAGVCHGGAGMQGERDPFGPLLHMTGPGVRPVRRRPQHGERVRPLREANQWIKLLERENEVLRRVAAYLSRANLP